MENKLQQLNTLIDFLKSKRKSTHNKNNTKESLPLLIEWLKKEKEKFLEENLDELKSNIEKNFKKLRISALSLMEYDWNENSHSNIFAYLIDYGLFEEGAKILSEIVKDTSFENKDTLCEKIMKTSYSVNREFPIHIDNSYGRIDLFIEDKKEKFIIIIENKIFADIGVETIVENEASKNVNQLEKYKRWCEKEYSDDYSKLYILLSFNDIDDALYERISYEQLFVSLKKIKSRDNIFEEYSLLLDSLLNPIAQDLSEIKKLSNKIIQGEKTKISLTDYYTLKTIFYAK